MKHLQRIVICLLLVALVWVPVQPHRANAVEDAGSYLTLSAAADYVRNRMANFETDIAVKFRFDSAEAYSTRELWDLLKAEVTKHTGKADQGDYMHWTFQSVGYYAEEVREGNTHYVTFEYITPTYNNSAAQEKELDAKVTQILTSLNLAGKTDYEKIRDIYQYVCQNVMYSEEVLSSGANPLSPPPELQVYYSAYGALVLNSCTCQGFSSAIHRLMLEAGIDCRLIAGDDHGWNSVKLDGKYYYLDATWDSDNWALDGQLRHFLQGSASFRLGGERFSGGWSTYEHKTWVYQFDEEFLNKYPISVLDYGQQELLNGDASTVLGSGQCGDSATWTLTGDGKLTVSGTGAMWDTDGFAWLSDPQLSERWRGLNGYIKTVEIGSGITSIGGKAFMNCPRLTSVSIPNTVTSIGDSAFSLCENLTSVTLPNSVKEVGSSAFYQCVRLKSATLSSAMDTVPDNMFIGCTGLQTLQIPAGIKVIGRAAFANCTSLGNITLPNTLTTLEPGAFACSFDPAKKVSITIPESVTSIGWECFCEANMQQVIIKGRIKTLPEAIFNYCHYLQSVTLPDSLTTTENRIFCECTNLRSVALPDSITSMGNDNFITCLSLETAILPSGITSISTFTFSDCVSLKNVEIPASVQTIGNGAFSNCRSLTNIKIPASVKSIGDFSFSNCVGLKTVKFEGAAPASGNSPFSVLQEMSATVYYPKNDPSWTEDAKVRIFSGNPYFTFVATHGPNDPHSTGVWQHDETTHWQICPDCGEISAEGTHNWDAGTVTWAPTCKEEGVKTYTCTDCGAKRTEKIEKLTEHTYDYPCDEACNVCGATRPVTHSYSSDWTYDNARHWHPCTVCGDKKDAADHCWEDGACADCGMREAEATEPADPPTEPTDPPTEPTAPSEKPTDPTAEPTDPPAKPDDPTAEPTEPVSNPSEPSEPLQTPEFPIVAVIILIVLLGAVADVVIIVIKRKKAGK